MSELLAQPVTLKITRKDQVHILWHFLNGAGIMHDNGATQYFAQHTDGAEVAKEYRKLLLSNSELWNQINHIAEILKMKPRNGLNIAPPLKLGDYTVMFTEKGVKVAGVSVSDEQIKAIATARNII